jgi:hypothetical protein
MLVPGGGRARGWSRRGSLLVAAVALVGLGLGGCEKPAGPIRAKAPALRVELAPAAAAPSTEAPDPSASAAPADPTCGVAGLPDCPLQYWMDHHLNGPLSRDDFPALVASFRDLGAATPPGLTGWKFWSDGGALAASRHDHDGVLRACKGCHDGYRARYRATMRERPLHAADPP